MVVARRDAARQERESGRFCGPVVIDEQSKAWLGAARATNNTAELHGLAEACRYLLERQERQRWP